ncbi:NACHT domain-containing protein [Nonomuraea typhae]|uniref:NACHT domain-containing protein n=1 Tax=Nonomuraea typhae TaxID=2603600 RepID=UPI001CA4B7BB|nr:hypothetical protein [Nonomuraea typhae]
MPLPDSRHKYLYERLGDHDFQQLIGALLTERFPDFVPLPLRQADGGRDGIQVAPEDRLIYQVKWSATGSVKDPVSWLEATITDEARNIRRLAAEGTTKYILVTNVPSTGRAETGTFDKLNKRLVKHSKTFGLDISAMWREAINPMVDSAPNELKWAYADMLAGWDLFRYLISEEAVAKRDSGLRALLRKVAAAQWAEDECIKFSQVELDRERVSDLFVDVPADRVQVPLRIQGFPSSETDHLGGAAAYVTSKTPYPFTLVRGAPGQGKSTLSQIVCQAFRVAFMPKETSQPGLPEIREPRFPLRFDLADYAAWIQGFDVFDKSDTTKVKRGRQKPASEATIECFLAELMSHAGGSNSITASVVQDLLDRVPSVVVLDGLDEVASTSARRRVVREIDMFCSRGRTYAVEPKVIVTSRPNSAGLPEPNTDIFEVISLSPMDHALRDQYLRRWCAVHNVRGNDSRTLRRNFNEKVREPYIGELVGNPMQLTILLYLLRQHGDATPSQRTELYDAYMNLLLAREANKHPESVRRYRTELMEIIPFIGWYIQSRAEEESHSGRMARGEVEAAMKHFQRTYGKPENVVDTLFDAATDRLWALTGKVQGTYEFEVLSLREYFAARYLYKYAGEGDHRFDRTLVFRELLRRPYWLNTTRFYGGNAGGADIYALRAGIEYELADNPSKHVRVAAWSLITDGVFNSRPLEAAAIVDALTDDHGSRLLLDALDGKAITALPETSYADRAWLRLTRAIATAPESPDNHTRVRVLRELLGQGRQFTAWWVEQLKQVVGTDDEIAWLRVGAASEAAAGQVIDIPELSAEDGRRAQLILNTGAVPKEGSVLEAQLLRAVLDGQCSDTTSVCSEPARVAVALSPAEFYSFGASSEIRKPGASSPELRSQAIQHLGKSRSPYAAIASWRRFRQGEKGSTFPWANTAAALFRQAGRCWLVTEIAVIGAASPLLDGYTLPRGAEALGPAGHPAALIAQTRTNQSNASWWRDRLGVCDDDLSQAEWVLALWGVAGGQVIDELFPELEQLLVRLPARLAYALRIAALRLGTAGFLLHRTVTVTSNNDLLTELLAARHGVQLPVRSRPKHFKIEQPEPLAGVARRERWLKVDQAPNYR